MTDFINITTPYQACLYARNIQDRGWKEAEPLIMTDPFYAYFYAKGVLKRRWKEAEPVIKSSIYWDDYARYFNIKEKP